MARATERLRSDARGGLHDAARPRHRGRRRRRRGPARGGRPGHRPRSAPPGGDTSDRRTGSYGPKGFAAEWDVPQGAEEADGPDPISRASSAGRSAQAPTGSRCTPTTGGARAARRGRLSRSTNCGRSSRPPRAAGGSSRRTRSTAEGMRRARRGRRRDDRARRRRRRREVVGADEGRAAWRCAPPWPRPRPRRATAGWQRAQPAEPPDRIRAKRQNFRDALAAGVTDLQRQRRRRLRARRQCARDRAACRVPA